MGSRGPQNASHGVNGPALSAATATSIGGGILRTAITEGLPVDYLQRLDDKIAEWWIQAQPREPRFAGLPRPLLPTAITELDARSFLRGMDTDPPLYRIQDGYRFVSPLLPETKLWNFIETRTSEVWVSDEVVVHYGAAADLVLEYGWAVDMIESEPRAEGLTKGAIDLLIRRDQMPYIGVEAKGDSGKLANLLRQMRRCAGTSPDAPPHPEHKKCLGLQLFRPELFWVVAAGPTRRLFRVKYATDGLTLIPEDDEALLEKT